MKRASHWLVAFVALALGSGTSACNGCGEDKKEGADAATAAIAPVPAPDGLLCDVYVTTPNSAWGRLQRGIGGAVGILPATLPGVVVTMSDLDPLIAAELDGTAPMFAVLAGDPADPDVAFAMRVVDLRRARGLLFDGDTARFNGRELSGMTVLVPKARPQDHKLAAALTANGFFVVSRRPRDLERLAPYVSRTLPSKPLPTEGAAVIEVPRSALETSLKPKLEGLWNDAKRFLLSEDARMRKERGGRAPDFGDPVAIVTAFDTFASRRLSVVGDLDHVRIVVDVTDDSAGLAMTLTPKGAEGPAKKWIDGMRLGDAAPLMALPQTSVLAVSSRDGEGERAEQAAEIEKAVASALGPRLKEPESKRLHEVMEDWVKARGDELALAVTLDEPTGALLRAPVRDGEAAGRAVRGTVDFVKVDPLKELLRVREVTATSDELPGFGKISTLTVARTPRKSETARDAGAPSKADNVGVAWWIDSGVLALAAGAEPSVTLRTAGRPDKKLGEEPQIARFAAGLEGAASTIVVVQPLRIDPKRANLPPAPLSLSVGRKGNDATVRLTVSDGLLREAARWQMGF